ncbi:hypothetical protein B0H13DRAFT_1880152 [Mycena leptocephala]|nr:hypothetical protein B0H13DRAFT_1880152 [Mycena leptocephala]
MVVFILTLRPSNFLAFYPFLAAYFGELELEELSEVLELGRRFRTSYLGHRVNSHPRERTTASPTTRHLAQTTRSPGLLDDLREPQVMYSRIPSEVQAVVAWLKSIQNTAQDLLQLWQSWQVQHHPQTPF